MLTAGLAICRIYGKAQLSSLLDKAVNISDAPLAADCDRTVWQLDNIFGIKEVPLPCCSGVDLVGLLNGSNYPERALTVPGKRLLQFGEGRRWVGLDVSLDDRKNQAALAEDLTVELVL